MFTRSVVVLTFGLLATAAATEVQQCPGDFDDLDDTVQLNCERSVCVLNRTMEQQITIKFTPDVEISNVTNDVRARVLVITLPQPFEGVDGVSVCDKITLESGEKASCPLAAGITY